MNFVINRAELIALTGIKRTQSFALQKTGELRTLSQHAAQGWFELAEVLHCVAMLHGLPQPDELCVEKHARLVVDARLRSQTKRKQYMR